MDKTIALGVDEWAALSGLPDRQFRLYMALRWRMDRISRTVGYISGVSYQALAEDLEVEPAPGRHSGLCGKPSKSQLRDAVSGLVRAGLVESRGSREVLVFFLPKAVAGKSRQKEEPHGSLTPEQHPSECANHFDFIEEIEVAKTEEPQGVNGEEPHTSRSRVNHLYVVNAAAQRTVSSSELSTGQVLPLPLPVAEVAEKLRAWERSRGMKARLDAGDKSLRALAGMALSPDELRTAYDKSVSIRVREKSPLPINPGLVLRMASEVIQGRVVCRGVDGKGAAPWFNRLDGLQSMAKSLGIAAQGEAEAFDDFRLRVRAAHGLAEDERRRAARMRK